MAQAAHIRDEEVVADELHTVAKPVGQRPPAVPLVLRHRILDRDDGVAPAEAFPVVDELVRARDAALEPVGAVAPDLARSWIESDRDPVAVPGTLGRLHDRADGVLARAEVGRKAALVPHRGR